MNLNGQKLLNDLNTDNNKATEPAFAIGLSTTTLASMIYVIVQLFFPHFPDEKLNDIALVAALVLPIIAGLVTRNKVWSPASVEAVVEEATAKAFEATGAIKKLKSTDTEPPIDNPVSISNHPVPLPDPTFPEA
jgi:hypothetical protein